MWTRHKRLNGSASCDDRIAVGPCSILLYLLVRNSCRSDWFGDGRRERILAWREVVELSTRSQFACFYSNYFGGDVLLHPVALLFIYYLRRSGLKRCDLVWRLPCLHHFPHVA